MLQATHAVDALLVPRSIRYQLSIAKLPLAKDIDDFAGAPVIESLVRELATGTFVAASGSRFERPVSHQRPCLAFNGMRLFISQSTPARSTMPQARD